MSFNNINLSSSTISGGAGVAAAANTWQGRLCPEAGDLDQKLLSQLRQINASLQNSAENKDSTLSNLQQLENRLNSLNLNSNSHAEEHADVIQMVADVGYLVSLIALVLAVLIFTCIKRLRCPKNSLHLQLFLSFIIRCVICQVQHQMSKSDSICQDEVSLISNCNIEE